MPYLTLEQRESLHRKLSSRAAVLREEIAAALRPSRSPETIGPVNHLDEIDDQAVADLESSIEIAEVERDSRELRQVENALRRLRTLDFGVCDDCGATIPYSRLIAEPSATRCIACQAEVEHLRVQ
jgi:DnaK suppressor protein